MLPAIYAKWLAASAKRKIYIQYDNAKPHTPQIDREIEDTAKAEGWNIQVKRQPPNSPDMNLLDLGFFNSIQSIQNKKTVRTLDELIAEVLKAFNHEQNKKNLNKVFLSLQQAMISLHLNAKETITTS